MRKITVITLLGLFILGGFANVASAAVRIIVEGSGDEYPHYLNLMMEPFIEDGKSLGPLRAVAEELGFQVSWDLATSGISIQGNNRRIDMNIGSQVAMINSVPHSMNIAPRLVANTAFVSLRFLAEFLGYNVEYSSLRYDQQIFITPYTLISDSVLSKINGTNFIDLPNDSMMQGFMKIKLKKDGITSEGIQISSSIRDVLQVYGVPRGPNRTLNYPADWSGKLSYWGTFIPQSDIGSFLEFTFEQGALTDLTICY